MSGMIGLKWGQGEGPRECMRWVIRSKGEGLLETDDKGCKSHFLEPQGLYSLKYEFFREKKITAAKSVQIFSFSKTNLFHSQTLPLRKKFHLEVFFFS